MIRIYLAERHKMKTTALASLAVLVLLAAGVPRARADVAWAAGQPACEITVELMEGAEKKLGGALYKGSMKGAESMAGVKDAMPGMTDTVSEMKGPMAGTEGAHEVHEGRHGGVFFMAPNKIHHIEALYSEECGFKVFAYNAFTESIDAGRFQAFFKIVPENDDEWDKEVIRFLSPTAEGGFLQAKGNHDIKGPYKLELFVQFPESDAAEMFNIPVGHKDR